MSAKEKQGFSLYFLIAFGLAWLCQVGGCMALLQQKNAVLYQLALIATMFCPLLAVLLHHRYSGYPSAVRSASGAPQPGSTDTGFPLRGMRKSNLERKP